ncbi:YuzD family protein [Halobacillus faecis]|uniref:Disulfide oxidoreductase n=1 Tax=Halobacillus faecis TaxID=360184 RepID=A0A511WSX0_9BACI|nr:YuzD family protein [Halobacillus faecis]GEN54266.1 disulfide oxidoreductase [Halobacillus faecis]
MGEQQRVRVEVYGADVKCASCVNAPGSRETYEWLQAAIGRKYNDSMVTYNYYDISQEGQDGADFSIIQQLLDDELFYPLVLIENEIVGEGDPRLKKIYKALDKYGLQPKENS